MLSLTISEGSAKSMQTNHCESYRGSGVEQIVIITNKTTPTWITRAPVQRSRKLQRVSGAEFMRLEQCFCQIAYLISRRDYIPPAAQVFQSGKCLLTLFAGERAFAD